MKQPGLAGLKFTSKIILLNNLTLLLFLAEKGNTRKLSKKSVIDLWHYYGRVFSLYKVEALSFLT